MRRLLAILVALLVSLAGSPPVVHAGAHTYDVPTIARVGVPQVGAADPAATLLGDVGSAPRSGGDSRLILGVQSPGSSSATG